MSGGRMTDVGLGVVVTSLERIQLFRASLKRIREPRGFARASVNCGYFGHVQSAAPLADKIQIQSGEYEVGTEGTEEPSPASRQSSTQ